MAWKGFSFRQRMSKMIAVLAVAALVVALFAQQGLAQEGDQIAWQKPQNKLLYWTLNSNGSLKNGTVNDGWGTIGSAPGAWWLSGVHLNGGRQTTNQLLMMNTGNGKTVYWNLNSNGTLKNNTVNDGWANIHPSAVGGAWRIIGVLYNVNQDGNNIDALQMFNTGNRKAAYWVLNSNGSLKNTTINDGWGNTNAAAGAGWFIATIQPNADTQNNTHLILQNSNNGKSTFWKLNSNGSLKNTTVNDGWRNINSAIATAWRVVGAATNSDGSNNQQLYVQNTANGKINYWNLNSNGTLKNTTVNDGWGVVGTPAAPWVVRAYQANGSATNVNHLVMVNSNNGKSLFWRLNSNGSLKNSTQNDGWGYLYGGATQPTSQRIGGIQKPN